MIFYRSIILLIFIFIICPFSAHAQLIVPIDSKETFYCAWVKDKTAQLRNNKGIIQSTTKIKKNLNSQLSSLRKLLVIASNKRKSAIRAKIAQIRETIRGVNICAKGDFGIDDGIPDLPVNPNSLIVATGVATKTGGSAFCVVSSYIIREGKSNEGPSGFIFCRPNAPTASGMGFSFSIFSPIQDRTDFIFRQSRYTQHARSLLDGDFCGYVSNASCVSEVAQRFRQKILENTLVLELSVAGSLEDYIGTISCTTGCR